MVLTKEARRIAVRVLVVLSVIGVFSTGFPATAQGVIPRVSLDLVQDSTIRVGDVFNVQVNCETTNGNIALFSCFTDIDFPENLVQVNDISYSAEYTNFRQDLNVGSGEVTNAGAVAKIILNGQRDAVLPPSSPVVATLTMTALDTGEVTLTTSAHSSVFSEITVLGEDGDFRNSTTFESLTFSIAEALSCAPSTVGVYRPSNATFYITLETPRQTVQAVRMGNPGDTPLIGDWDGDGVDGIGIWRNGTFFLRNDWEGTGVDIVLRFANPDDVPIVGDWNNDGIDTVGVYRPNIARWFLKNTHQPGPPDEVVFYGNPNEIPIVGQWDIDSGEGIGIFRRSNFSWILRYTADSGIGNVITRYGNPGTDFPVPGDWDGNCTETLGLFRTTNATFYLQNSLEGGIADIFFRMGNPNDVGFAGRFQPLGASPAAEPVPVVASDVVNVTSVCAGQWEIENPTNETIAGTWQAFDGIGGFVSSPFVLEPASSTNLSTALDTTGLTLDFGGGDTLYTEATMAACD